MHFAGGCSVNCLLGKLHFQLQGSLSQKFVSNLELKYNLKYLIEWFF